MTKQPRPSGCGPIEARAHGSRPATETDMAIKISKKITGYSVHKPGEEPAAQAAATVPLPAPVAAEEQPVEQMHERLERPEVLEGRTYKIKSPLFEHALYVTINDIVLNAGTEYESRRPFEIFINSKNMDHFQWAVALTRIMSAVFRKGGDVAFIVDELKAVFDPRGGYFKTGGIYMPSLVAELGYVVEDHLKRIGMLGGETTGASERARLAAQRVQFGQAEGKGEERKPATEAMPSLTVVASEASPAPAFPPSATLCGKCHTKAVVWMDGCQTCLNCGYSKCG
jgi:hypothetical protein